MAMRTVGAHQSYQQTYRDADGKGRTQYLGCGPVAKALARLAELRRQRRLEIAAELREIKSLERAVIEFYNNVRGLSDAWLRSTGHYCHHGEWRRTGPFTRRNMVISEKTDETTDAKKQRRQGTSEEIGEAIEAENQRRKLEAENIAKLKEKYDTFAAGMIIEKIVSKITDDGCRREELGREAAALGRELAGPAPTAIEKVLAERVMVCRMDVLFCDVLVYCDMGDPIDLLEHYQSRQDRSCRRYLRAIEALARCRKVDATIIQQMAERLRAVG
jgi:hypothetical protein